jgi:DNA-binding transcriptional LysR family regulator
LCASPDYIAKNGVPITPADISAHNLISSSAVSATHEWRFGHDSDSVNIKIKPRLTVTTNDTAIEAAMQGFGITRLMSYQAAPYIASGQLRLLLQDFEPEPIPIHVLHREGRYASAKIRSFVDMIAARLRADRTLNFN